MRTAILCTTLALVALCAASALSVAFVLRPTVPRPVVRTTAAVSSQRTLCGNIFDGSGSLCAHPLRAPTPTGTVSACEGPALLGILRGVPVAHAIFAGVGVVSEGDVVGPYLLSEVGERSVALTRGGVRCHLELFEDGEDRSPSEAQITQTQSGMLSDAPIPQTRFGMVRPFLSVEGWMQIPRSLIRDLIERPTQLGSLRAMATPEGLRVFGIRAGSSASRAGLRNGDTLVGVDGRRLTPDVALELISQLDSLRRIRISLVRRGEPVELRADLVRDS